MNIVKQLGDLTKGVKSKKFSLLLGAAIVLLALSLLLAFPLVALWSLNLMGAGIPITWKSWAGAFLLWAFLKITLNASRSEN